MRPRKERLRKLLDVQNQLKSLHETRRAGHLAAAANAAAEAADLVSAFDESGSLAGVFPEIYHRRVAAALARRESELVLAQEEAARVAAATARTNMVERAWQQLDRMDQRQREDRDRLELIEQRRPSKHERL